MQVSASGQGFWIDRHCINVYVCLFTSSPPVLLVQVGLCLPGKMCNGMVESISDAYWPCTSGNIRPFSLLVVLAVLSTGHGLGECYTVGRFYRFHSWTSEIACGIIPD